MADFTGADLGGILGAGSVANTNIKITKKGSNMDLDMTDFITLMITQLTNQGIDESVNTSEMLNQMIQMQMVETIATLTDASVMSYAASLVGQTVTVGKYDSEGKLQEIVGKVTGTGTMNGNQVIFVNGEYYQMSEILAVGTLPKTDESEDGDGSESGGGTEDSGTVDPPENTEQPPENVDQTGANGAPGSQED